MGIRIEVYTATSINALPERAFLALLQTEGKKQVCIPFYDATAKGAHAQAIKWLTDEQNKTRKGNRMSAVVTRNDRPSGGVAQIYEPESMMQIVRRIAQDPTVDLDRLERFLAMQERMETQQAEIAYNTALAAAQSEMRVVVADKKNTQTNSKYASYAALDSAVRPIYTKHGFSVTFDTDDCAKTDYIRIVADVTCGSHKRRHHIDMPADGKGAKGGDVMTKTHAVMSATSYGKRGLLILIFNIPVADKWDDDGNAAGGSPEKVTADQIGTLRKAIEFFNRDEGLFCKVMKVSALSEIAASRFDDAKAAIETGRAPR